MEQIHKSDCVFCRIIAGEISSISLYDDEDIYVFRDINPQAPVHFLVSPKKHIESAAEVTAGNSLLVAKCFEVIASLVKSEGLEEGFRVITNSGINGRQTVNHLHFHVLGGQFFKDNLV